MNNNINANDSNMDTSTNGSQIINNNRNNSNDNNRQNKKKVKFIVIGVIVAIIILGVFVLIMVGSSISRNKYNKITDNTNNIDNKYKWYTPEKSDYKIDVHYDTKNQNYSNVHFSTDNNSDGEILGTYYCESNSCKSIEVSEKGYVLIKDIDYIIYDYMSNKAARLNMNYEPSNTNPIEFLEKDNKLVGIYYSYDGGSYLNDGAYFVPIGGKEAIYTKYCLYPTIKGDNLLVSYDKTIEYYDLKKGKLDKTIDINVSGFVELIQKNSDLLYIDDNYSDDHGYVTIYNNNLEEVLKFQSSWYYFDDKYIYFYDWKQRSLNKYDSTGELFKTINNIDMVRKFKDGYSFIIDNKNQLKLINLDNNVIEEFGTIQDGKQAFYEQDGEEFPTGFYGYDKNRNYIVKVSVRNGEKYRTYLYNMTTGEKESVDTK